MINLIIRSLCTFVLGLLLITFRQSALPFIIQCIGVLFMLPSVFALVSFFVSKKKQVNSNINKYSLSVIITSVGSLLLALWMLFYPGFFTKILMWLLGFFIVTTGIYQIVSLLLVRKNKKVSVYFFIVPIMLVAAGALVLANPFEAASIPFLILGIGAILASIFEIINNLAFILPARNKTKANT